MTTADITATRHPKSARKVPALIAERLTADRRAARDAHNAGNVAEAWRLLERTHILSQPWAWPHVRSHIDMLHLAIHTRDRREIVGQLLRILVAGPGSATGRYPTGNTGRANVSATLPMEVPDELAGFLTASR